MAPSDTRTQAASRIAYSEMGRLLQQLAVLDRARTEDELMRAIRPLLEAVGRFTCSSRVYLLDFANGEVSDEKDFENNWLEVVFQWCADDMHPIAENCKKIELNNLAGLMDQFRRNEPLVIDDISTLKDSMPLNYPDMVKNGVTRTVAFPLYHGDELSGFVGVDNPATDDEGIPVLQLLAASAGHLACQKSNIRRRKLLEDALALAQLNNEIISAISKIYFVIYRLDLENDTYEEVSAGEEYHRLTGKHGVTSEVMREIRNATVADDSKEQVRDFFDTTTLISRLANTETISMEYHSTDGNWYVSRYIVKKRRPDGTPHMALYVARAINDQKRREFEYQAELRKIADDARAANLAKTDFLRRMSHDIRTPINGVRGMIEMMNSCPDDMERQQECRDKIWNASGYLLSLVSSILDMNKLESGDILLENEPFDLRELLDEVAVVAGTQAQEHDIRFNMDVDEGSISAWHLIGSSQHIKQVLLNLTSNAVKYGSENGFVTLHAAQPSSDSKTATMRFICEDNGIGMSESFQKHAFEPFTQEAQDRARTNFGGTGLGLSIVKKLVERMGGTIALESELGQGSKFIIELPLAVDASAAAEQAPEAAADISGMHVLIAEDNDLNAEIAQFMLESKGVIVDRVADGREAVHALAESEPGSYDAVLMDLMMPNMDGHEACRRIRASRRTDLQELPIFAMTANAFTDDIQRSLDAGMNGHLTKPLDEERITKALGGCCKSATN